MQYWFDEYNICIFKSSHEIKHDESICYKILQKKNLYFYELFD